MYYTLGQAAKMSGLSKSHLSRAVKSGRLSASRNPNGSLAIEAAELDRVFPATPPSNVAQPVDLLLVALQQLALERRERIAEQAETIRDLRARLVFAQTPPQPLPGPKHPWWRRVLGWLARRRS
jgi:hypothetical protein